MLFSSPHPSNPIHCTTALHLSLTCYWCWQNDLQQTRADIFQVADGEEIKTASRTSWAAIYGECSPGNNVLGFASNLIFVLLSLCTIICIISPSTRLGLAPSYLTPKWPTSMIFIGPRCPWSDLCVRMSVRHKQRLCRLNWCDSGWWGNQLNTNW